MNRYRTPTGRAECVHSDSLFMWPIMFVSSISNTHASSQQTFTGMLGLPPSVKLVLMILAIVGSMALGYTIKRKYDEWLHSDVLSAKLDSTMQSDIYLTEGMLSDYWLLQYAELSIAEENLVHAVVSKWMQQGNICVREEGYLHLVLVASEGIIGDIEMGLWQLLNDAAEHQPTLTLDAFGRWGNTNNSTVDEWIRSVRASCYAEAHHMGYVTKRFGRVRLSEQGIDRLRELYTLRSFTLRYLEKDYPPIRWHGDLLRYIYLLNVVDDFGDMALCLYAKLQTDPEHALETVARVERFSRAFANQIVAVRATNFYQADGEYKVGKSMTRGFAESIASEDGAVKKIKGWVLYGKN